MAAAPTPHGRKPPGGASHSMLERTPLLRKYAKLFSLDSLQKNERQTVVNMRLSMMLRGAVIFVNKPSMLNQLMKLCCGDAAFMAGHIARTQATINVLNLVLAPVVSSLSDAIGRRAVAIIRPLGIIMFNITLAFLEPLAAATGMAPLFLHYLAESLL